MSVSLGLFVSSIINCLIATVIVLITQNWYGFAAFSLLSIIFALGAIAAAIDLKEEK